MNFKLLTYLCILTRLGSFAFGQDGGKTSVFDIVDNPAGTFLIDRTAGRTWMLELKENAVWREVQRQGPVAASDDTGLLEPTSSFSFKIKTPEIVLPERPYVIQAVVGNLMEQPLNNCTVRFSPPTGVKVLYGTEGFKKCGDKLSWEVEQLRPRESRAIELQIAFSKKQAGTDVKVGFTASSSTDKNIQRSVSIAVASDGDKSLLPLIEPSK